MGFPFRKILAAVEFGDDNSLAACELAAKIALQNGGMLYLLHVIPDFIAPMEGAVTDSDLIERAAKEKLKDIVRDYVPAEVRYEVLACVGEAASGVLMVAKNVGADLVVIGTHGRKGLSHLVLGSVAEKVVREASCAVLTLKRT
jgi:universal stress protein A